MDLTEVQYAGFGGGHRSVQSALFLTSAGRGVDMARRGLEHFAQLLDSRPMEAQHHSFSELFAQLGLASDNASIQAFIRSHAPLPPAVLLTQASFWSATQSHMLSEQLGHDSDWAELVDQLDAALRADPE